MIFRTWPSHLHTSKKVFIMPEIVKIPIFWWKTTKWMSKVMKNEKYTIIIYFCWISKGLPPHGCEMENFPIWYRKKIKQKLNLDVLYSLLRRKPTSDTNTGYLNSLNKEYLRVIYKLLHYKMLSINVTKCQKLRKFGEDTILQSTTIC